ncbi:NAD(P)-dependent oxidoreductase [Patescibacteria group bacterium]|nr:NAD(P)-dependent oxidoreductase [Patescibacteria group bacterium]MBU1673268.1 NAD(P)-dependent oxidoreductase [Patescibacteria group bacterium]MBU1964076.1 NAD(P)-dependent oxidoreductase [Patescibacteria group bacterium]
MDSLEFKVKIMKIFVTGATGFIGGHLVPSLKDQGHEVVEIDRQRYDITDKDIDLQGAEAVYHLAGLLGKYGLPEEDYRNVNVEGTKNIFNLAKEQGVNKFFYLSSAGVQGPLPNGVVADERYQYNPSNIYEETKAEAERHVLNADSDMKVTAIRPEFIYGPGDMHVLGLFKQIQKGYFPLFGGGRSVLHPTYIDDLIFVLQKLLERDKNGVYIIAGEQYLSVEELADKIASALDTKIKNIKIPRRLALAGAITVETASSLVKKDPPITKAMIEFFTGNRAFDTSKARADLDFNPISLDEGLKKTVDWYKEKKYL